MNRKVKNDQDLASAGYQVPKYKCNLASARDQHIK